jgi:hypothetical protein
MRKAEIVSQRARYGRLLFSRSAVDDCSAALTAAVHRAAAGLWPPRQPIAGVAAVELESLTLLQQSKTTRRQLSRVDKRYMRWKPRT